MKTAFFALSPFLLGAPVWACPTCRPLVQAGIFNPEFARNLALLSLPFWILGALSFALWKGDF